MSEYHEETAVAGAELWSWLAAAPLSRAGPAPRSHQLQLQLGMILTFSSACRSTIQDFSPFSVLRLSAGLTLPTVQSEQPAGACRDHHQSRSVCVTIFMSLFSSGSSRYKAIYAWRGGGGWHWSWSWTIITIIKLPALVPPPPLPGWSTGGGSQRQVSLLSSPFTRWTNYQSIVN